MKTNFELADILQQYGHSFLEKHPIPEYKQRVLRNIENCRTAALGGHKYQCNECGQIAIRYNSCGNRHCPKCQHLDRERWVRMREADLLPVKYFHVVFTVPHELNSLFLNNQKEMYNLLFTTAWSVLKTFSEDEKHLGAKGAMTSVLHTWGQNMSYHPHLHCIVPAGGITKNEKWKASRSKGRFLYPVKALSQVFRARFVEGIKLISKEKQIVLSNQFIDTLFEKEWVIYAKRPFKKANTVLKYLGRYTHRIAIANNRIENIEGGKIKFSSKNYRNEGKKEVVELTADEFLRRFCLHILPPRFRKIRHYGFLAGRKKKVYLAQIRRSLNAKAPSVQKLDKSSILEEKLGHEIDLCPHCKKGHLVLIEDLPKQKKYNQLE